MYITQLKQAGLPILQTTGESILKLIEKIFSVKNENNHKVVRLSGLKLKFKRKINIKIEPKEIKQQNILTDSIKNNYFLHFTHNNFYQNNNQNDTFNNFISFRYDYIDTPSQYGVNLGDYVQSIATLNLIKKLYPDNNIINFDRDNLGNYDNVPAYTIMQGWFSNSYTFLPNNRITPVYVGTHITPWALNNIFKFLRYNPSYFKNETIGCRDKQTQEYFTKLGIPNYLSRCLTLTFPKREVLATQNKIFLVNLPDEIFEKLPPDIKNNAEIINQRIIDANHEDIYYYNSYDKYIEQTNLLLNKYKTEAKLVITPALHCASPCIAMGIPVILLENKDNQNRLTTLDGIIKKYSHDDFMNNAVDYEPEPINIEDLKEAIIKNLELSINIKKGLEVDRNNLKEIRRYIQEYNIL